METEAQQVRDYVIRPVLEALDLWSEPAEALLLGTAAHESNGFSAIRQYGNGPAMSMFQIEPFTHNDLWQNSIPGLRRRIPHTIAAYEQMVAKQYGLQPPPEYLIYNRAYAAGTARLLYYRQPFAMPATADLPRLAAIWKRYYNTEHGKGTEDEWLDHWAEYCE